MGDKYEQWQTYVEKEKTRELLNEAMKATPIRDQWRQIIVVTLAVAIVAGVFAARTNRFQKVLVKIEQQVNERQQRRQAAKDAGKASTAARAVDPETAIANAENQWARESSARGPDGAPNEDGEIQAEIAARQNLGANLEKIAERGKGAAATGVEPLPVVAEGPERVPASATQVEANRVIQEAMPVVKIKSDSVGIGGGEIEPEVDVFHLNLNSAKQGPGYKALPSPPKRYAGERKEFPDLP